MTVGFPGCTLNLTPFADVKGVCDHCGKALVGRQSRWCTEHRYVVFDAHDWNTARRNARARDGHKCVKCGSRDSLEVNHIEPRVGQGYGMGCWNHLDNLETLCHACHVVVTKEQAAARRSVYRGVVARQEAEAVGAVPMFEFEGVSS